MISTRVYTHARTQTHTISGFRFIHLFQIYNRTVYIRAILYHFGIGNGWRLFNFDVRLIDCVIFCIDVHLFDCFCAVLWNCAEPDRRNGIANIRKSDWFYGKIHTTHWVACRNLCVSFQSANSIKFKLTNRFFSFFSHTCSPCIGRMADKLIDLMRAVILSTLYGSVIFFATSIFQCEMVKSLENMFVVPFTR